ncbi:hypothetical protein CJ201_09100 [Corynebacterium aurimucosum]|nr:hypothetical protein CJ201_09100 [Corynebacterium aurimucosum]
MALSIQAEMCLSIIAMVSRQNELEQFQIFMRTDLYQSVFQQSHFLASFAGISLKSADGKLRKKP